MLLGRLAASASLSSSGGTTMRRRLVCGFVVAVSLGDALAQDAPTAPAPAPAARSSMIEEIVVTAQKREQDLQDVGIAIAAFSGDTLTELGVKDTTDLANLVAGFSFTDSGFSIPIYTLRGVGFNEISQTATSAVGIYVDEVNLPFPTMSKGASLDLERVEVLKGPQGTLYGRNTTGGAINFIARKPSDRFEAGIAAGLERFWTSDVEAYASGPITESLGARLAVRDIRSQEGWQYDYTRPDDEQGKLDKQSGRFLLDWHPDAPYRVRWSVDGWLDRSESQSPQYYLFRQFAPLPGSEPNAEVMAHPTAPDDDARASAWNPEKDFELDQQFVGSSLRAEWDVAQWATLTTIFGGQLYQGDDSYNNDGLNVTDLDYDTKTDTKAWSAELRLSGRTWGDSLDWVVGYFHGQDDLEDTRFTFPRDGSAGFGGAFFRQVDLFATQDAMSNAVFGQGEWQWTDAFKFTLGVRYTNDSRSYDACTVDARGTTASVFQLLSLASQLRIDPAVALLTSEQANALGQVVAAVAPTGSGAPLGEAIEAAAAAGLFDLAAMIDGIPGPGECITLSTETGKAGLVRGSLDEDNVSGRAAVDWTPTEELRFYLSYSIGYKAGSYPSLLSATDAQYRPVKQERVDAVELGAKTQWFDGMLRANAAAFYYDYQDKQLFTIFRDPIFGPIQRLDNVPKSRIFGLELDFQAVPLDSLFLSLGTAFLHSEVVEYRGIDINGDTRDFEGNELDYTPPVEVTALASYTLPTFEHYLTTFGIDGKYSATAKGDLSNDPRVERDAYTVLNARLGFAPKLGPWSVQAFVRNFTDEVYYTSFYVQPDVFVRYAARPRTYGVTFRYDFQS
jgi:iron complex outermembrane recepter protein